MSPGRMLPGLLLAPTVTAAAQDAVLTIVVPAAGDYVSDRVRIDVRVEPAARARDVTSYTFYADGREVCRVDGTAPARCDWDAAPQATIGLVAFNDEMFPIGQATDPIEKRLAILDRLQAFGATALFDVMMRGLDDLARGSGRRALVVFTDGDDQASRATRAQVRAAAEASDVTVYFVALGRGQAVEQLREGMEDLATLSGGRALRADRTAQLDERFGEVLAELAHQYLIGYAPTNVAADGRWRKIALTLRRSDLRIRARLGYRAPAR